MCSKPKAAAAPKQAPAPTPDPTWKSTQTADRGAQQAGDPASIDARRIAETGGQSLGNAVDPANPTKTVLGG